MRAVVFANGIISNHETVRKTLRPDDLIIAADGGFRHCRSLRVNPHLVIGDLDSLPPNRLTALQKAGVELLKYPTRKDYTDLELALHQAVERGAQEILVFGALGKRWDMTLANLLLPAEAELANVRVSLVDGNQEVLLVRGGSRLQVTGQAGDTVSLIPAGGDAHGIHTQGLEYPLHGETLYFGATRGISNVMLGESVWISLESGTLLCVVIHMG